MPWYTRTRGDTIRGMELPGIDRTHAKAPRPAMSLTRDQAAILSPLEDQEMRERGHQLERLRSTWEGCGIDYEFRWEGGLYRVRADGRTILAHHDPAELNSALRLWHCEHYLPPGLAENSAAAGEGEPGSSPLAGRRGPDAG